MRTHGSISLFQVRNNVPSNEWTRRAVSLSDMFTIDPADIKSGRILDMSFEMSPTVPSLWLAMNSGAVYRCRGAEGRKVVSVGIFCHLSTIVLFTCPNRSQVVNAPSDEKSAFWSVRPFNDGQTGLLASEKFLRIYDTRVRNSYTTWLVVNSS